jgi:hypothetical protein
VNGSRLPQAEEALRLGEWKSDVQPGVIRGRHFDDGLQILQARDHRGFENESSGQQCFGMNKGQDQQKLTAFH